MDNMFLAAGLIAVIFFIAKFLEMKYIHKEMKPLSVLFRDALVVYVSVVSGMFLLEQLTPILHEGGGTVAQPMAFTDNPPF